MTSTTVYFQVHKLINLTTEINLIKIQDGERIEASEYDKDHICFVVEAKSCSQGQLVKIEGVIQFTTGKVPFSGLGKILKVKSQENSKMKIMIELRSHDKEVWQRFTTVLTERQKKLDELFSFLREDE